MMGRADHLILGDWNVICYQCGRKRKASYMEKNWQNYYVCPEHNEPRQPQDFARGTPDAQTVPWSQPDSGVVYTYIDALLGFGDGLTTDFQFGDGLQVGYQYNISQVRVNGNPTTFLNVNAYGLIRLPVAPAKFAKVTASGTETTPR